MEPEGKNTPDTQDQKTVSPSPGSKGTRLVSLDAMRGFDMFWIIGGTGFVISIIKYLNWPWLTATLPQFHHAEWHGFTKHDLIFPMFIFISGATMPFSFDKHLEAGYSKMKLYWRVIRRAFMLVLLGCIYNGMLQFNFAETRYLSVLGLIGMAYLWASLVVINFKPRGQFITGVAILIGYYILMNFVPVPGHGAGVLTPEGNFASWIDRMLVPGRLHGGVTDPEGLLMTIPAAVFAIFGALSGKLLKQAEVGGYRKCLILLIAGLVMLGLGWLWNPIFPVNKKLWTSSFVLYATGWSLLHLTVFYLLVDLWGLKKIFFPFVLIGMNPITIYFVAHRLVSFGDISEFLFGGLASLGSEPVHALIYRGGIVLTEILFLYFLYRKKIFLRV